MTDAVTAQKKNITSALWITTLNLKNLRKKERHNMTDKP
jgi:hypothetical protein